MHPAANKEGNRDDRQSRRDVQQRRAIEETEYRVATQPDSAIDEKIRSESRP